MRTEAALKLRVPPFVSCAQDFLHRDSPYTQVRTEEILELFQNPQADAERTGAGYVFSGVAVTGPTWITYCREET